MQRSSDKSAKVIDYKRTLILTENLKYHLQKEIVTKISEISVEHCFETTSPWPIRLMKVHKNIILILALRLFRLL